MTTTLWPGTYGDTTPLTTTARPGIVTAPWATMKSSVRYSDAPAVAGGFGVVVVGVVVVGVVVVGVVVVGVVVVGVVVVGVVVVGVVVDVVGGHRRRRGDARRRAGGGSREQRGQTHRGDHGSADQ